MTRYYKRRYRKQDDSIEGAVGIILIAILAYIYTNSRNFMNQHPYVPALVIVLAVMIVLAIIGLVVRKAVQKKHQYDAIALSAVDTMDGLEFERYLADLLKRRGYTDISLTEKYDLGVDIIAKKDGVIWGIQAKRYSGSVKAEAIRQAYTALNRYHCNRAMVITNSVYSRQAKLLAADNNVVLIDRQTLSEWIYVASKSRL